MGLGLTARKGAIKKHINRLKYPLYLKECDEDGTALTTGDGTIWTCVGITQGIQVASIVSEEQQIDDRNVIVDHDSNTQGYDITFSLMQRDAASRNFTRNAEGKYYQAVMPGQVVDGTLQEVNVFAVCKVSPSFTYTAGGDGHITNLSIKTISHDDTITITLPTEVGTGSISIAPGKMMAAEDIAI